MSRQIIFNFLLKTETYNQDGKGYSQNYKINIIYEAERN